MGFYTESYDATLQVLLKSDRKRVYCNENELEDFIKKQLADRGIHEPKADSSNPALFAKKLKAYNVAKQRVKEMILMKIAPLDSSAFDKEIQRMHNEMQK